MRCAAQTRKPVSQITDRAKRYRANRCKKKAKFCETCGSRKNLVIGHRDGNESNGAPHNLGTFCKSCNGRDAAAHKKAGRGVRTRQYNPKLKRTKKMIGAASDYWLKETLDQLTFVEKNLPENDQKRKQISRELNMVIRELHRRSKLFKNPGATNLAQYVQAAVEHARGSHDAGGRVIHETPKSKRREFAREIAFRKGYRSNPESPADALYRKFHGIKADNSLVFKVPELDPYGSHPELAQFGLLVRFIVGEGVEVKVTANDPEPEITQVEDYGWSMELQFVPSYSSYRKMEESVRNQDDINKLKSWLRRNGTPDVAGEPNSRQIYIVGGDQNADKYLGAMGADPEKELIDLGFCYVIEYYTQKRFDRAIPTNYFHSFGEKTGVPPRLIYWRKAKLLQLVGGEYFVTARGIEN